MSNQYDFICNGRVVYKGTQFTEYEKVEEDKPEAKNFSELWAKVEAAIPLFVLGCLTAYVEDNGFTPPSYESNWDSNWFCFGKAVGHAVSLAQATYEISQGFGLIGAGLGGGVLNRRSGRSRSCNRWSRRGYPWESHIWKCCKKCI